MIFIDHKDEADGKITLVEIKGELDSSTSTDFEEHVNQLLAKKKIYIILNAEKLDYISSGGIGVILYLQKKILSLRGFFIICNISEEISALYSILGFDKIIKIAKTKDEALDIMEKQINMMQSEGFGAHDRSIEPELPGSNPDLKRAHVGLETGEPDGETVFPQPLILECSNCKGLIRLKRSGTYICPDCKTEFVVEPDQTVVF